MSTHPVVDINNIQIFCPTIRPHFFNDLVNSVAPVPVVKIDGTGYTCFSKLINKCIMECPTEIVIIANDKARPTAQHVQRMLQLLSQGFGFVALYRLGFFAFHKDLIRRIGFFDERFEGGGYEDNDIFIRLKLNNIATYVSEEIPYITKIGTTWNYRMARTFYDQKYTDSSASIIKKLPEEKYDYQLGPSHNTQINAWDNSHWTRDGYLILNRPMISNTDEPNLPLV